MAEVCVYKWQTTWKGGGREARERACGESAGWKSPPGIFLSYSSVFLCNEVILETSCTVYL